MYPGMLFLVLSRDPDFYADFKTTMEKVHQAQVYWATTMADAERLSSELPFEMILWDPYFRVQ